MATAALVNQEIELGRRIIATLTRASIPVTVYLRAFIPELEEWQFIVATPLVDSKGPLGAYNEVNRALQRGGIADDIYLATVFLRSPGDRVLKALEKDSKIVPHEAFRVVNAPIAGRFVEDAYLYKGFISVAKLSGNTEPPMYSVFYAPYDGPSGIAPDKKLRGTDALKAFLVDRLHINSELINSALNRLCDQDIAAIPNVEIKRGDLKRLGLA
jgi:hypothetical protein